MPTIIDALVVQLDLDPKKFNEGQKDAVESLRKLEDGATKHVKATKSEFDGLLDVFKAVQGRLLAISALVATGIGFESFTAKIARANAETGYLANNLGVSVQELQKWEAAGATVGAQANEIAQSFATIQKNMASMQLTGSSQLNAFAYSTHMKGQGPAVELYDQNGQWRSPNDILLSLSRWAQAQPNKAVASQMLSQIGMGQGMTNMLMLGPDELQKRLKFAEQFAPDKEQIQKFQDLGKAFGEVLTVVDSLQRDLAEKLAPALTSVLTSITDWMAKLHQGENPGDVAGEVADKTLGWHELAPNENKPSWTSRYWNWLLGRKSDDTQAEKDNAPQPQHGTAAAIASTTSVTGSAFLQQQRAGFAAEMQNPSTRRDVAAMAILEGAKDPTRVVESLANRIGFVNNERAKKGLPPITVEQMLHGGFYGPINRGELPGAVAQLQSNTKLSARINSAIDSVVGGSNLLRGFTDQGLPTDPNGWRLPHIFTGGNVFNDWNGGAMFGVGGASASAAYRQQLMAGVAREASAAPSAVASSSQGSLPSSESVLTRFAWLPGAAADASGAGKSFGNWRSLGLGARGALVRGGDTNTTNTNTSSTSIGQMNVTVPHGADPVSYAHGIQQELQRWGAVADANTGLF